MIIHVDMDAFYASVEQRDEPSLRGKPVVVGGSADGRGVVAAASYEARALGIHSAMSAKRAKQLCPHAVFIRPRISHYAAISKQIRAIFEQFTPLVEPLSLDEAFLDVRGTMGLFGSAEEIGLRIKQQILEQLGLVASVGVAPNKFLAKIASDLHKPNALVVVPPDRIQEFLDPLPVSRIWGIGKVSSKSLERISVTTIGQLRQLSVETLTALFGTSGERYSQLARGIDQRSVVPDREAKSISTETTFGQDIDDADILRAWLVTLVEQVAWRMRVHHHKGKTVDVKVRFSDFKSVTRSMTLEEPTDITDVFLDAANDLFDRIELDSRSVRLLGFGVSGFSQSPLVQQMLFDEPERIEQRKLDSVADEIAKKFGKGAIHRALGHEVIANKTKPARPKSPPSN